MSERVLLRNKWMPPLGTQKFGFFFSLQQALLLTLWTQGGKGLWRHVCTRPELLAAWWSLKKWWPDSFPIPNCQVWVLCGNGECSSLIPAFLLVSLCGWKNSQERQWFKFSYVLKKQSEAICLSDAVNVQFYVWCWCAFLSRHRYLHRFS